MEIKDQIRQFIVTNFYVAEPSAVGDETSLLDQGIIDSTGVLEVISFLESTFAITVADDEMLPDNLDTIGRIAAFVAKKKRPAPT